MTLEGKKAIAEVGLAERVEAKGKAAAQSGAEEVPDE
jgi:hypothetical protein